VRYEYEAMKDAMKFHPEDKHDTAYKMAKHHSNRFVN
jgi:hypothetical protein